MRDNSLYRVGGMASIILGILGALASLTYLVLPAQQRLGVKAAVILPSIAQGMPVLRLQLIELALVGVLGLVAVPAISELVRAGHEGWVRWMSTLALIGFAVAAVSNFFTVARLPAIAAAYNGGDPATQAALAPIWRSTLDLYGLWGYGAVGLWILGVSLLAMSGTTFSRGLVYLGLVAGIAYLLIPAGFLLQVPALFLYDGIIGGIASTAWFIWAGLVARRYTPKG